MSLIRQSNRAHKSRDYWNLTNSLSHQRQSSVFIIYTKSLKNLDSELSHKDLDSELSDKDLGPELSDEDLSLELDEDLSKLLSRQLHEDLDVNSSYQLQFLSKK